MHMRFVGLARDAWYLFVVLVGAGAFFWFVISPIAGVATVILGLLTFAYFAFMRYDDNGRERDSG
jgi:hypothetical protein